MDNVPEPHLWEQGVEQVDEPLDEGQLSARPRQLKTATAMPAGVHRLDLAAGKALIYIPDGYRSDRPSPVAVMLHGAGGSAEDGLALFRPLADEAELILLAPQSSGRTWDLLLDGYGPDLALLDQALELVFGRYAVDLAHVLVGGFSDGRPTPSPSELSTGSCSVRSSPSHQVSGHEANPGEGRRSLSPTEPTTESWLLPPPARGSFPSSNVPATRSATTSSREAMSFLVISPPRH